MNTIRGKMLLLSLMIWIIMAGIWLSMSLFNQSTVEKYNGILQRYLLMNEAAQRSQQSIAMLNDYRSAPTTDKLENYRASNRNLLDTQIQLQKLRTHNNESMLRDYRNLLSSQSEAMNLVVRFQINNDEENVTAQFDEATMISKFITEMTLSLISREQTTNDTFYRAMIEQSADLRRLGLWTLALVSVLLLMLSYRFVNGMSRPVLKLTHAARELSRGDFTNTITVNSKDEMSFLAATMDSMRLNIRNLIEDIQSKSQLESDLQQHKLLLKESELKALQSQINPHFLFNTLNMLSKEAYLAGAESTSDLISSVAKILRYNLGKLDSRVTLRQELAVLDDYLTIQKARFGERLRVVRDIDEHGLRLEIPMLILQPFVENVFIYVIEPSESGGTITIRVIDQPEHVWVQIEDDGPGLSDEQIERLYARTQNVAYQGHSTGIGILNVIQRLRLFFGVEDVVRIESTAGQGTCMTLILPKTRG